MKLLVDAPIVVKLAIWCFLIGLVAGVVLGVRMGALGTGDVSSEPGSVVQADQSAPAHRSPVQ